MEYRNFFALLLFITNSIFAEDFIIAASANMQYALEDIKIEYAKEFGKSFTTVISSSGKLATQIKNSAPFSIFLSADMEYPKALYLSGYATAEPTVYARGTIVLWSKRALDINNFPFILIKDNIKSIAIANPDTAPYGKEALRILKHYKIYENVKAKLVYAESISQVNQYVLSESADIGFTAKSVVISKELFGKGIWMEPDSKSYNPIQQGIVILSFGLKQYPEESKHFYNFLFSKKGKTILKNNGYLVDEL